MATNVDSDWETIDSDWEDISVPSEKSLPQLDLDMRRMTGSMNPTPPNILPQGYPKIPSMFGQEAGSVVTEKLAEEIGKKGYPKTGAALGTAAYVAPVAAQTMMLPDVPIPKFISKGSGKVGKLFSSGVEKITGIPAENVVNVFKKPTSLFTAPTEKEVSKAYAKSELVESTSKGLGEIIEKGTGGTAKFVKRGTQALNDFVENGVENPKIILEARQALDQQIALLENQIRIARRGTTKPIQNAIDAKVQLRQSFNRALDKMAPNLRSADALASERFKVAPFRDVTIPGKINLFSPEGIARAVPGLPTAIGGTVAASGTASKLASQAFQKSPKIINAMNAVENKLLTEDMAKEYFDKANGDIDQARQMARDDGWTW